MRSYVVFLFILSFFLPSLVNAQNVKIGFIDLKKVFRDYKKVTVMEETIRQETEAEMSKIKGLKEEVKQLKEEIPLYKAGSKIRQNKEKRLTEKLFEIKYAEERANHFFTQKLKIGLEDIYREVSEEIEEYARKNNFFMVLRVAEPDFFGSQTAEALRMQIHTRDVLYWGKDYDITNTILERMNENYTKEARK
ncbi:MAG: OmpH family outer membrane protein [Candidatus Brocadiae bacterium]|nr:OmpH family outer membrane protein [Candidatus Brocadiia bacterium]